MRAEAAGAPGSTKASPSARPAPRRGAFAAALALARGKGLVALHAQAGAGAPARAALARRRCDADDTQRKLSQRRDEAEPEKAGPARRPDEPIHAQCTESGRSEAAPAASLVSASAIERIAIEAGRIAGRPFVDMSFGRDFRIRITRSTGGVELLLTPVPALRARGVRVSKAEVRAGRVGAAGSGALTARRTSATNAGTSHPGGTVAKW